MAYKLAFIGYDNRQTGIYFEDFAIINRDKVARFDKIHGRILLRDGTEILRFSSAPDFLWGRQFDQVIVADDRRRATCIRRRPELDALGCRMAGSIVPEEFRYIFYDLDAEVAPDEGL